MCAHAVHGERRVPIGRTIQEMYELWRSGDMGVVHPPGVYTPWYFYYRFWETFSWYMERPGHVFNQVHSSFWNMTADGSGGGATIFTQLMPAFDPGGGYLRVYAQWLAILRFNINHPSSIQDRQAWIAVGHSFNNHNTHYHTSGYTPTFPTTANWSELGGIPHAFMGWNTQSNGQGEWFYPETIVSRNAANPAYPGFGGINAPFDLFAIWSNYVTFHHGAAPSSVILPHHQFREVVPLGQLLSTGVSPVPDLSGSFPTGIPSPNPNWPNHEFIGWNTNRDGFGSWVTNTFQVTRLLQVYAVWNATVTFNATGGTVVVTAGLPGRGPTSPVTVRALTEIGRDGMNMLGPGSMQHLDPERPHARGPWEFAHWNTVRWGLVNNTGVIYTWSGPVVPHNMALYAQWQTNVIFDLDGGNIAGNTTDVVRTQVPELSIMDNRPIGQRIPPDPEKYGHIFVGWEREVWCNTTSDYIWVTFTGQCEINEPNILVIARWRLDLINFEFIKTDDGHFIEGITSSPLPGAIFRLWRQEDDGAGIITWIPVEINPGAVSPASVYELASAPITGSIALGLTRDATYRLREVYAPAPFRLPPDGHYWEIVTNDNGDIVSITRIHSDPSIIYRIPEFIEVGDVLHLPNIRDTLFRFHKTNWGLYYQQSHPNYPWEFLLEGAHFRLFRFIGTNLGTNEQVTINPNGSIADTTRWAEVSLNQNISTGLQSIGQYISYSIDRRYIYQLVEVLAPPGFTTPWGQWRITVVNSSPLLPVPNDIRFDIASIGCSGLTPPGFVWRAHIPAGSGATPFISDYWFVGNQLQPTLPLTGGTGSSASTILLSSAGMGIVLLCILAIFIFKIKKSRRT